MVEDDLKEIEKNVASSLENNSNKEKRELLEKQEELVEAQKELADAQIKLTEQEEEKEESKPGEKQKTAKAEKATIEEAEREEKRRILIKKHPDMKEFFENADADTIDFHHKKLEKPKKNSGLGSSGAGSDPENTLKVIMFILSIIVIFADSILTKGFNRNFNYAVYYIGLYLFLSLAYFFLHMIFVKNEMKESFRCLAIGIVLSVLQIVILWFTQHDILKNLLGTAYPPVAIIIMLLAPWLFYFIFINHIEGRAATWIRVLLFAFIIMVFLFIIKGRCSL